MLFSRSTSNGGRWRRRALAVVASGALLGLPATLLTAAPAQATYYSGGMPNAHFDKLNAAKRAGADVARIDVDPGDGHPVRITIDPDKNAVDDELCYTISNYGEISD